MSKGANGKDNLTFFDNYDIIIIVIKGVNSMITSKKSNLEKERLKMLKSFSGVMLGSMETIGTMPLWDKGNLKYVPLAGLVTVLASTLIMTSAISHIHKLENPSKKKRVGLKIFAGSLILATGIGYGTFRHAEIDHSETICPVTKVLMETNLEELGVNHQIKEMQEEYQKENKKVDIIYEDGLFKPFIEQDKGFYVCDKYLGLAKKIR